MTPEDRDPVDDELDFHVEMLTRRYVEEGLDAAAAMQKALARMGDLRSAAAERVALDRRWQTSDQHHGWWHGWSLDLWNAWRVLRRSPGFVAIAVVMLGLGSGASAAIFSVVDGVILRSPFAGVGDVALLLERSPDGQLGGLSRQRYEQLTAASLVSVQAIGVDTIASPVVSQVDVPKRTQTVCLSGSMPAVIGTAPRLGRWFAEAEARPGASPVAVVSHVFWQRTLGGDPQAVGRVIALDGTPVLVIGVMPPGFDGPYPRLYREVWVPYWPLESAVQPFGCRTDGAFTPLVRIRAGAGTDVAAREINSAAGSTDLVLRPYADDLVGDLRNPLNALTGAVLAVLLIAFANVTNLGLERLAGRRREVAVRLALGATRAHIVRETIAEHVLVSMAGGLAGIGIAFVAFDAMVSLLPPWLPNLGAVSLNMRVLLVSLALTLAGGMGAGAVAAWHTSTSLVGSNLAPGDRGHTEQHPVTRKALVAAQLALGVLLLVGALLMVRTFLTLRPNHPGFEAEGKHIALIRLPPDTAAPERLSFITSMIDELRSRPGVRAVAATTSVPMRRSVSRVPAEIAGTDTNVFTGALTPNYLELMGIPVRRGRGFTTDDHAGSHAVGIVNEAFVSRWLADREPLGQVMTLGRAPNQTLVQIVGVVADIRSFGQDTEVRPFVYRPLAQAATGNAFLMIDVNERATVDVPSVVRSAVASVRPGLLVDEVERLVDEMNAEVTQPRLGAWLFGVFAALAVLLAAVGLAATLTWAVTQRRREIGIRMALGARPGDVRSLMMAQSLGMSLTGIAVGLAAAAASTRLLAGWLYGVTPLDPPTFAACGVAMLLVSLVASYLPVRRASRVDPVVALRGDLT